MSPFKAKALRHFGALPHLKHEGKTLKLEASEVNSPSHKSDEGSLGRCCMLREGRMWRAAVEKFDFAFEIMQGQSQDD